MPDKDELPDKGELPFPCDAVWICTTDKNIHNKPFYTTVQTLRLRLQVPAERLHINQRPHGECKTSEYSVANNHICAWNEALSQGHQSILVVEDDIHLAPLVDVARGIRGVRSFLESHTFDDWDILYIGGFAQTMQRCVSRYSVRPAVCWATHGYMVNQRFMTKYKDITPEQMARDGESIMLSGTSAVTMHTRLYQRQFSEVGIDGWMVLLAELGDIKSFAICPHLLSQSSRCSFLTDSYSVVIEPGLWLFGNSHSAVWMFVILLVTVMAGAGFFAVGLMKKMTFL